MDLTITPLDHGYGLPAYATEGSAGMDLQAAIPTAKVIPAGQWGVVPTGIHIEFPTYAHEGQIRSRSGLAAKKGLTVLNAPGTVDPDYTGEVRVLLVNHHPSAEQTVEPGERIAELVIAPVMRPRPVMGKGAGETQRGAGGFGSTGS